MNRADLIAHVRAHAARYYATGWDTLVECWSDADIDRSIGRARTAGGALRKVAADLRIPVRIDAPYILSIHAEDGDHYAGFASFAKACRAWSEQSGRAWDQFADRAWAEYRHVAITDDYGRRIILAWNR